MDPHTRKHHYAQGLIHPVIRDLIRDAVRPTFGFGVVSYTPRSNDESVTLNDTRKTATADPNEYWYTNISATATTALIEPLRNALGQFYEERVNNGVFLVDSEWSLAQDAYISGGQLILPGTASYYNNAVQTSTIEAGHIYEVVIDFAAITDEIFVVLGSDFASGATSFTTTGIKTYTITPLGSGNITIEDRHSVVGTATINSISVVEVDALGNPTNVLDGGRRQSNTNVLLNSDAPATQTTPSLGTGFYALWSTGSGTATVSAGTATIDTSSMGDVTDGTDGSYIWFEVTGAGTVTITEAGTLDTFDLIAGAYTPHQSPHISTVGSSVQENEDAASSVVWEFGGEV